MSKLTANLIGVRVAGSPIYTPAHITPAGKTIRQRATFSVYANGKDGKEADKFKITAWGKMADSVAKSVAPGKKLTLVCEINTYLGKVPYPNNNPNVPVQYVTDANGQPMMITKTGYTIEEIDYGVDSAALIISEIQAGLRPMYFAVPGHADEAAWKAICKQRNDLEYVIGSAYFGYAKVQNPSGQIIDYKTIGQNTGTALVQHHGSPAAVGNGFAMPGQPVQNNTGYTAPVAPAPVMVHGVNMGLPIAPPPFSNVGAPAAPAGFRM